MFAKHTATSPTPANDLFASRALDIVPRVLGLCDRDPVSPTFGCCDRSYWHYRLIDVANARAQEAGWLLAQAQAFPHPANPFFRQSRLATWSRAIWRFWLSRRNSDGSVQEVYPFERSFCATSFSAAAFTETVRLLGGAAAFKKELKLVRPTMLWLGHNSNPQVFNQMAASMHALAGYAGLTGDLQVASLALKRRDEVLRLAGADGVLPEYGGLDVGYQTISLACLAAALRCPIALDGIAEMLERGLGAIAHLIGETGQVLFAGNSRRTQFLYPSALARHAPALAARLEAGLRQGILLHPGWMDDRYCIALATDYFLAAKESPPCS